MINCFIKINLMFPVKINYNFALIQLHKEHMKYQR